MRWTLTIVGLMVLVVGAARPAASAELQPHMAGWERYFTVEWQPGRWQGRPVVQGYVNNVSPYSVRQVQILVDSLDGAGHVTSQKVATLAGDLLGGGRAFFQVPATPSPAYRVRVFTYDRIETESPLR
jgi:hypothetical protein